MFAFLSPHERIFFQGAGRACALRVPYTTQYGRDVTEAGPGTIACAQTRARTATARSPRWRSCYHLGIHHSPSASPRLGVGASPTGREHACFPSRAPCNEVFQLLSAYLRDRRYTQLRQRYATSCVPRLAPSVVTLRSWNVNSQRNSRC